MPYRNPDTGRYITHEAWERFQGEEVDVYEDYEDLEDWDSFDEEEVY